MKISKKEVEHVANLARLNLSADELETMTGQLDNILSYVDKLEELFDRINITLRKDALYKILFDFIVFFFNFPGIHNRFDSPG